jgi:hypothetical protein
MYTEEGTKASTRVPFPYPWVMLYTLIFMYIPPSKAGKEGRVGTVIVKKSTPVTSPAMYLVLV